MSLATRPTRALPVCGTCAGNRVTSIAMTLTDGSAVDVTTVLGKAQKHKA